MTELAKERFRFDSRSVSGYDSNEWLMMMEEEALDITFHALADPTRRAILAQLARGESNVSDLARPFPTTLAAISKHLKVLERAGLIRRERRGRVHALRLEIAPLRAAGGWIEQYQRFWRAQLSALDLYLKEMKKKEKS